MDFTPIDDLGPFREGARKWVNDALPNLADEAERQRVTGDSFSPEIHRFLAEEGWLGAGWPEEYGGSDRDPGMARAIYDEIADHYVRMLGTFTTGFILNTIRDCGTEEQKRTILRAGLRGEMISALGYTEPDTGSDLAAARTRSTRVGDEWLVNGQKMFTTNAHLCTHAFMVTRSDPNVPKHQGITMLLVPLDQPGVEIRGIWTVGGERTNATFYTDAKVSDFYRIGGENAGWSVARIALVHERSGASMGPDLATSGIAKWAQQTRRDDGSLVWHDPTVKERIARFAIGDEVTKSLRQRTQWELRRGDQTGVPGATAKAFTAEHKQRRDWEILDILGAEGLLHREAGDAPMNAMHEENARESVVHTIYGGATEVMRNMVAERKLGFPRIRHDK